MMWISLVQTERVSLVQDLHFISFAEIHIKCKEYDKLFCRI